ncbi:DNA/RNA nuclease SfsA [Vannielia litorea]|uniref:Sugar fermentation stimulation protein homolog n=1 Tax=Vannielia litorea TaxID=1217970 RepID=A0A1N6H1X3_9RHOB|nr:DNA/RNA nuclease SfsA [Vannielia litorea]SIO13780.1 sugar fermentation stimulation protein A [Vannielia litorea]
MRFATPLVRARLLRRYKRFLADAVLEDGREVVAHCPNPGAMTGLAEPGTRIWLEPNDDPKKKLNYGWRLVEHDSGDFTGIDTALPNRALAEALAAGAVPGLTGYQAIRAEVPYGASSRVDFLLTGSGPACYVEVKSVTLMRTPGLAEFPDTVTARGARHMAELAAMAAQGHRAMVLFLVQRTDAARVGIAADIDPAYATAFTEARAAGVEAMALSCSITPEAITPGAPLPLA